VTTTAIAGKEIDQVTHGVKIRRIEDVPAIAPGRNQAGVSQAAGVKIQFRGLEFQPGSDIARGHAAGSGLDQQSVDGQPGVMAQCGEGFNGSCLFHISIIIEI
jgi:hypothetical protein